MSWLRARLASGGSGQSGMTLVELLVAAAMSVVLLGAVGSLLISAVRDQPKLSKRSQNITTARWVLERMTREIRNGIVVYEGASSSSVSFLASVRRTTCGGAVQSDASQPAIHCRITYSCSTTTCTRRETASDVTTGGALATIVSGLDSSKVFNYSPTAEEPTYIGVTLHIPNPGGSGDLVISDGASLRTLTFAN